jgi:uncharacterized protein (DUF58 family)
MPMPSTASKRHASYQKALLLAGLTAIAYIAALNRGQALPWGIATLLLATLVTGLFWPHLLIRGLSIKRTGPEKAEEGETVRFQVEMSNPGWIPRFMVQVVDRLPFMGAAAENAKPDDEHMLGTLAYLGGGTTRHFEIPVLCEKRGYYRLGPVGVASSFPLGLAEARLVHNSGVQSLTIYPDLFPIVNLPLAGSPTEMHRGGLLLPQGSGSAEFSGLREYRRGDQPRHVHWLTTARSNQLMVKEFEPLASASLYLALDMAATANVGQGKASSFEYAVRIAASIGRYASLNGMPFRIDGEGRNKLHLGMGAGEAHFRELLEALAVVNADGRLPYSTLLQHVALNCRPGQSVVVFLSVPEDEAAETIQSLAMIRAREAYVLAYAFDRASFAGLPIETRTPWLALHDLDIPLVTLRKGDDLVRLFNP